jgi:hypothetical protein
MLDEETRASVDIQEARGGRALTVIDESLRPARRYSRKYGSMGPNSWIMVASRSEGSRSQTRSLDAHNAAP